jgi:hypothetical protein
VPNDFAAFVALNGHMGVGSLDGDLPTYANNMAATPVYAVNTGLDRLYPADVMRRTVAMARGAGADIYYKEYDEIGHEFTYAEQELPLIADFLERHPRDPFPHGLTWEAADKVFGQCRWFRIDKPTTAKPAPWHGDHNVAMVDDRVTFGFFHDAHYEGDGVKVQELIEDDCLARRLPLVAGDIIVRCNEKDIETLDDLDEFKTTIKRGDRVSVRVIREGVRTDLAADMPDPVHYLLFKRHRPSAKAKVSFEANRVSVEGSRLGSFSLLLHPEMFHFDQRVVVEVDGEVVFDDFVEPNVEFILRSFLHNRDRRLVYVAELSINLTAHD